MHKSMQVVVVGGHSRDIGKTSVMVGLIRAVKPPGPLGWTAVKVTQYGHGICSHNGRPCGCEPREHPFALTEERDAAGRGDTCRFLAAGARRSLWLRVRQGELAQAFPVLQREVSGEDWVMIESNSIVEFLAPDLYLMVIDSSRRDFKESAQRFFERVDALVTVKSRRQEQSWPLVRLSDARNKPVFPVSARDYSSPALVEFVMRKLTTTNSAS
jgi:hypothetical protein